MKKVMYQGTELTIHEREDWQPAKYPIKGTYRFRLNPDTGKPIPGTGYLMDPNIWNRRNPALITHQAVHYTADDQLPDTPIENMNDDVFKYIQAMQISYARNRAYSLGYTWIVDYLGGIWECRGRDVKCAAHAPANEYADAILVLIDLGKPISDIMAHSIRYLIREAQYETQRGQVICGHRQLKGTSTGCPGDVIINQINSGFLNPIIPPIITPPTNPEDIFGGTDMAQLIRITDNNQAIDPAVFSVTGTFAEWISTQGRGDALVLIKAVEHGGVDGVPPMKPEPIDRGFLQYFTLLGQPPIYDPTYQGPKTSPADFARWVS
jgi:hypothetical protein